MPINLKRQLLRYLDPDPLIMKGTQTQWEKSLFQLLESGGEDAALSKIAVCSSFDGRTRPIKKLLKFTKYCDTLARV